MLSRIGATPLGVWAIKHVVSPLQRWLYQSTGGKFLVGGVFRDKILLLTTKGRHSGRDRATPVFYLRDGDRLVVCNVNPGFEHTTPWVLNLRAYPMAKAQIGKETAEYRVREATEKEMEQYWPELLKLWPAYQAHFERSRQRAVFVMERI